MGRLVPVDSANFLCLCYEWCVTIYPGGLSAPDEGGIFIFLKQYSGNSVKVEYSFNVDSFKRGRFLSSTFDSGGEKDIMRSTQKS